MPELSIYDSVVRDAAAILERRPGIEPQAAAGLALRMTFGLANGDGIYAGSEAAVAMGHTVGHPDENLMSRIVEDVTKHLPSATAAPGFR